MITENPADFHCRTRKVAVVNLGLVSLGIVMNLMGMMASGQVGFVLKMLGLVAMVATLVIASAVWTGRLYGIPLRSQPPAEIAWNPRIWTALQFAMTILTIAAPVMGLMLLRA